MIDFGLAGLFERFEQTLGKRLTWLLTVLIGLAVAVTCIRLIASAALPVYRITYDALVSDDGSGAILVVFNIGALVILAIAVTAHIVNRTEANRAVKRANEAHMMSLARLAEAEDTKRKVDEQLERAQSALVAVDNIVARIESMQVKAEDHADPPREGAEEEKNR
jgi:uncharacterized membrane protein